MNATCQYFLDFSDFYLLKKCNDSDFLLLTPNITRSLSFYRRYLRKVVKMSRASFKVLFKKGYSNKLISIDYLYHRYMIKWVR